MGSYRNHYAANFSEFRKAEVRRIPKFLGKLGGSKSQSLATFSCTVRGDVVRLSGWSGSCTPKGDSFEGGEPEIATGELENSCFYAQRVNRPWRSYSPFHSTVLITCCALGKTLEAESGHLYDMVTV
jgi:hypothetical protein